MQFGPNVQIEKRKERKGGKGVFKKVGRILYKIYFKALSSQDQETGGVGSMQIIHGYLENPFLIGRGEITRQDRSSGNQVVMCLYVCLFATR